MIPLSSDDREGPNGFRFKYTAQGSGMANVSATASVTKPANNMFNAWFRNHLIGLAIYLTKLEER